MDAVVGVRKIQLLECVSTSFGGLAKRRNHPRNGRRQENDFYDYVNFKKFTRLFHLLLYQYEEFDNVTQVYEFKC